ncbi:MAG: sensor histidine kinase [Rhodobacteraceae bacterium]|nr:sensor histidine kinase [Paracoccaceae bacterium]
MTGGPARASLRLRLMGWLAGPVAVVLAASVWLSYANALHQATLIMNRDLTSSARMMAEQVRFRDGAVGVVVPPAALEIFATDSHDEVAYAVFDPAGVLIAGFPGLTPPARAAGDTGPVLFDAVFRGDEVMRAVTLRQPVITPDGTVVATVAVGETLRSRNALVRALWLRGFAQQAVLVLAAALSIWVGISRELRPLMRLRRAVLDRPPQSVEPFDETAIQTELRPLVAALNAHMARLAAYLDRQQRFLDGAAHQMRTPLAILKMQLGVARRGTTPDQVREVLGTVDSGLTAMTRVTNQLLTLGRVEHERARQSTELVDLRAVLRGVVGDIAPRALDAGVDLVLDAEAPCPVLANGVLLREVAMNLVDNAIQHAGRGATATVSARMVDGMGVLAVCDTGPGVPPGDRARLFRRFARGAAGTGLGLTIVAEIAEMFGGTVELPPVATGFAVAVRLPLAPAGQGAAATNALV